MNLFGNRMYRNGRNLFGWGKGGEGDQATQCSSRAGSQCVGQGGAGLLALLSVNVPATIKASKAWAKTILPNSLPVPQYARLYDLLLLLFDTCLFNKDPLIVIFWWYSLVRRLGICYNARFTTERLSNLNIFQNIYVCTYYVI